MTQPEFPEFSLMGGGGGVRKTLPGFTVKQPIADSDPLPGTESGTDSYFNAWTLRPGSARTLSTGSSVPPPTTEELISLYERGLLYYPGQEGLPMYSRTPEFVEYEKKRNQEKARGMTGGKNLLKTGFALTYGLLEEGAQAASYVKERVLEIDHPWVDHSYIDEHGQMTVNANTEYFKADRKEAERKLEQFEKAEDREKINSGGELSWQQKRELWDEINPPDWSRTWTALGVEMLIPLPLLDPIMAKLLTATAKGAFMGGKLAVKPISKGDKTVIPGLGEIVDFITLQRVQDAHAAMTPIDDLDDINLFAGAIQVEGILEAHADELIVLSGRTGKYEGTVTSLEARIGKPQAEWTATDIRKVTKDINASQKAAQDLLNETNEALIRRDHIGTATFIDASTGEPFNGRFFNGSGRNQTNDVVYDKNFAEEAIFGEGIYSTPSKEYAQAFGPTLKVIPVDLKNPLVISNDTEWMDLINGAGLYSYVPVNGDEVQVLRKFIMDQGHDGVVIRVPHSEDTGKKLINAFGEDQVVDFTGVVTRGDAAVRILDMFPEEGSLGVRAFRTLAEESGISPAELDRTFRALVDEGAITRNTDGTYSKRAVDTVEPEAEMVPEPTRSDTQATIDQLKDINRQVEEVKDKRHQEMRDREEVASAYDLFDPIAPAAYAEGIPKIMAKLVRKQELTPDEVALWDKYSNAVIDNDATVRQSGTSSSKKIGAFRKQQLDMVMEANAKAASEPTAAARTMPEARVVPETPATPTQEIVSVRTPKGENPPGVPEDIVKAADDAYVNQFEIVDPVKTVRIDHALPDPSNASKIIDGEYYGVLPPPITPIREILGGKPKRFHLGEWWNESSIRLMEIYNDTLYGWRKIQGIAEKKRAQSEFYYAPETIAKGQKALKGDKPFIQKGGRDDLITKITLAPGAVGAANARLTRIVNEIKFVAPNVMVNDIDELIMTLRLRELLDIYPDRRIPFSKISTPNAVQKGLTYRHVDEARVNDTLSQLRARLSLQDYAQLEDAVNIVLRTYREERERLVSAGIISREVADHLAENHKYFNPIRYVQHAEKEAVRTGNRSAFRDPNVEVIKLAEQPFEGQIQYPMMTLAEQLVRNEAMIVRNDVISTLLRLAEEVNTPGVRRLGPNKESAGPSRTLQFWENGNVVTYAVPDFIAREADYFSRSFGSGDVAYAVGVVNGISKAAFTRLNPYFIPVNILFDGMTAMATQNLLPHRTLIEGYKMVKHGRDNAVTIAHRISGGYQARFFSTEGRHLAELAGIGPGMSEAQINNAIEKNLGGKMIYEGKVIGEKEMKAVLKDVLKSGFGISAFGDIAEQAPRQAFFKRELDKALGKGWEKAYSSEEIAMMPVARKAAADSIELTINFVRGSLLTKILNPFVPFINPIMEGLKKPFRAIKENPGKTTIVLASYMAAQTRLTAYNLSYPEYMDIPKEDRWGSGIFMLPSKEKDATEKPIPNYFTFMPATRDLSIFLGTPTYLLERWSQNSADSWMDFARTILGEVTPFGEIPAPPSVKELVEQATNMDYYRGTKIVPSEIQAEDTPKQSMPWTSETMKRIGEGIGVSPVRIDHAFSSTLGGTYQAVESVTDFIIDMIDPSKVTPETAHLVMTYKDIDDLVERKNWRATLDQEQRDRLSYELRKPETIRFPQEWPGVGGKTAPLIGPMVKRFYPNKTGALRDAFEQKGEELTGISPEQTRDEYAALTEIADQHLTVQQDLDRRLLVLDPKGDISPSKWLSARSKMGFQYRGALMRGKMDLPMAAQHADPEKRQQFYKMVVELAGNAPDDYAQAKVIAAGFYAISMDVPEMKPSGEGASYTLLPNLEIWEDTRNRQKEYIASLSDEEKVILEEQTMAGNTAFETFYMLNYQPQIESYYDYAANLFKDKENDMMKKFAEHNRDPEYMYELWLNYYNATDKAGAKIDNPVGHKIDQDVSAEMEKFRSEIDSYEMEKALFAMGKITSPKNVQLEREVDDLRNLLRQRGLGSEITNSLLIDKDLLYELMPDVGRLLYYNFQEEAMGVPFR